MAVYKQGMSGSGVKDLQTQLNKLGAGLSTDGVFGAKTTAAVVKFQEDNGLVQDGIAGAATLNMLTVRIDEKTGAKLHAALDAIAELPEVKELVKFL